MRQWGERDVESRATEPPRALYIRTSSAEASPEDVRERRRHRACVFKNATFVVVSFLSQESFASMCCLTSGLHATHLPYGS